ncbi:uncharacterized protein EV420DRAFT_1622562 [Desarmillaria tabescens]|uniref:Uncharacterized protein n=1 Tax=Armillaria tabescens TaxID=1929756 RepID=A0AA39JSY5_ARMTA|nr:uncharacterized protein EV420DRAFT_1622562 [Desarmillaria tabescens]KAK0445978.1 hypothetical protein EV420DRAFT_1622562 [Desarmillaria tabescens]
MSSETTNSPGWHSIRPWIPPLTLSVREITSYTDPLLACLGIEAQESDECSRPSFLPHLAGGLSVEVDRSAWRRVFIRIDDKADEAVIIIYGLMPGRQYDVDLELVQGGHKNNIRRQVVTEVGGLEGAAENPDSSTMDSSVSAPEPAFSSPSTSPSPSTPSSNQHPSPGFTPLTLEDRLNQLQHTLNIMATERETLSATLKSARRDAQKADANVRSEIEALKRSSEKTAAAEHRARQKVLALQETVKRAQLSTKEMEAQVKEEEEALPDLQAQRDLKEGEYLKIKGEADRARKVRESEAEKERKRVELMNTELNSLNNKLERLQAKKEKLEKSTIPDLEEQLKVIELEIETAELDPFGFSFTPDGQELDDDPILLRSHQNSSFPRPSPAPIQRPQGSWSSPPRQAQRSSSLHHQKTPVSSLKATHHSNSSSSSSSPLPAATSTLSSRAPPFEPGKPLRAAIVS